MHRRAFLSTAATALTLSVAGCTSSGQPDGSAEYDIGMSANRFVHPSDPYEVPVGTTIVWKNTGGRSHTVTAYEADIPDGAAYFASGGFESEQAARDAWTGNLGGSIAPGETYEYTPEVPGEYTYFCVPHEPGGMIATFVVTE
ncbi:plastocyanin/azurin family copper-binding protein [Haladaptatus sp. DYSN1]|uniref:plastocyanin/azurin family copper-binding protein n=1 Tax=unclassified Haladaptatus TaxID=2622732 RepID=UPI002404AA42|nr:plastocyanin/azurin family copper-binding protein [Haladaptatus sp. DYSN1]